MKKRKKVVRTLILMCIAALFLSGCTTFNNFKEAFIDKKTETEETIKIGVYEPMSGSDSEGGLEEIDGIALANKLYPTVQGKRVELIYADNKSDLDVAETAIVDLLKKNPLVILGSYGNIYSLVAHQYLEEVKVPGIAVTNTNPLVTSNNPYYFRVCFVESYQGEALARYTFENLKQKKTAILIPEGHDQAAVLANAYRDKFEALTKNQDAIEAYETYPAGQDSFLKQLKAIDKTKANTVFIAGELRDVKHIVEQAAELGLDLTFLGDNTLGDKEFIEIAEGYRTGKVAFSDLYNAEETITETSRKFQLAYEKEYGVHNDANARSSAALGFDAYLLALQAIEKAGAGCTGTDVRNMLAATEKFPGASGEITFTETGDPRKSVVINTISNHGIVPVCTIDPFAVKKGSGESKDKKQEE